MSNQDLLKACEEGDLKSVQQLLTNPKIDINYKDILIHIIHVIHINHFFIIFKNKTIYGIHIQYFIQLL